MSDLVVRGASVWTGGTWCQRDLAVRDGLVSDDAHPAAEVLDAAGLLVAPGFIDLQCNGAMGIDLASQPERLWELASILPRWGVTAWLPTIVTSPPGVAERALEALAAGPPDGWHGAWPLGLHLEGPFLAPTKRGAHAAGLLRPPSREEAAAWSRATGVAVVTVAPELPGAVELIGDLVDRGVVVSLGHSDATAAEAEAGIDAGATWVTHLFNAMPPLHHRAPGLAGVALTDDRLHVGLIADGVHVAPSLVTVAQRTLGARLTLVTDAVAALGLPPGPHSLGRSTVTVGHGDVRLPDGTLAGSVLSLDQAVRNLVAFTGCDPGSAVDAASAAPARVLGSTDRGSLLAGARADFVLLDADLVPRGIVVGGRVVDAAG